MVNNFQTIKNLLAFNSEDDFYYLQIIQRRKENPQLKTNNSVLRTYYVTSVEYLEYRIPEILGICDATNSRAYINLNRRSFKKMAFQVNMKIANQMLNGDFKSIHRAYEKVAGLINSEPKESKTWIVDIDKEELPLFDQIREDLAHIYPRGEKVVEILDTRSGVHIISKPFNKADFLKKYPQIDIHKNNPTILYTP